MATRKGKIRAERQKRKAAEAEKKKRDHLLKSHWCCTVCGEWIPYTQKRKHLHGEHDLEVVDTHPYFRSVKDVIQAKRDAVLGKQMRAEYERNLLREEGENYTCGERVSGPPFVHIIYNPVGTNRRKH